MNKIEELKFNLREKSNPYFSDEELDWLLLKHGSVRKATYEGLLLKAEDDSIKLPGLDIPSSKNYYLKLAKHFRPNKTGQLKRVDR
jgi:hypothetical protein